MCSKEKKLNAQAYGKYAEDKTAEFYIKEGYAILAQNWHLGKTEIDIIAQKDNVVVMIEVKARSSSEEDALNSITQDKRKRMIRAADNFIQRLPGNYDYRFDIVACWGVGENFQLEVIENAFLATDVF